MKKNRKRKCIVLFAIACVVVVGNIGPIGGAQATRKRANKIGQFLEHFFAGLDDFNPIWMKQHEKVAMDQFYGSVEFTEDEFLKDNRDWLFSKQDKREFKGTRTLGEHFVFVDADASRRRGVMYFVTAGDHEDEKKMSINDRWPCLWFAIITAYGNQQNPRMVYNAMVEAKRERGVGGVDRALFRGRKVFEYDGEDWRIVSTEITRVE